MMKRSFCTTLVVVVGCLIALSAGCGDDPAKPAPQTKDLTSFRFLRANNPSLAADVTGTISTSSITASVPFGTDVTALKATFATNGTAVRVGNAVQTSGTTANNFTSPVTYTVEAADGTTKTYAVTVTVAKNMANEITAFSFLRANNAALPADVTATINGNAIAATLPFGSSLDGLTATFTTTGASVSVAGTAQVSGTTRNNFASALIYRVTAADDSTRDYTVTVTVAPSTAKEITAFSFLKENNPALANDVTGVIRGDNMITVDFPFGTDVTALKATFVTTGASVFVGTVMQQSNVTANNFTSPVMYRVTAADSSTRDYTVTVIVARNPAKEITEFRFESARNQLPGGDVVAEIQGTTITATVPFGTDRTALKATFTTTGASVTVNGTMQESGVTPNDFSQPVTYLVAAADTTTKEFTVTVNVARNTAKDITEYKFLVADNPGLGSDVTARIEGTSITATVPFQTDITALKARFVHTGVSIKIGAVDQVSGMTVNDFTNDVVYRVTADDASFRDFTVKVTVAASDAKEITDYRFLTVNNGGVLTADVIATINGTAISATVPFGTDVSALKATFTATGPTVKVGQITQITDVTPNDFSNAVTYTVTAADNSTKEFTVTVTVALNPAKDITAFRFESADNNGLPNDVIATINETNRTISATVPFGFSRTALVATFAHTGQTVKVGNVEQTSGTTPNNFENPVIYTVTAADTSTKNYTVTVVEAPSPAKEITAFSFLTVNNPGLTTNVTAKINGTSIAATLPPGTNLNGLVATFSITGASVRVGTTPQINSVTPNNFTSPVVYTVVAADNSTKEFTVTLAVATQPAVTAFSFQTDDNPQLTSVMIATIIGNTITVDVAPGVNVSALVATFTAAGSTLTVGGAAQASGVTPNNFTAPVVYTATLADGSSQQYTVTVNVSLVAFFFSTITAPPPATFEAEGSYDLIARPVMSRGSGVTVVAAGGAWSGSNWTPGPMVVLADNDFHGFTVTPNAGRSMTLTRLALKNQRSNTGPVTFAVRSSRDGFMSDLATFPTTTALTRVELPLGAVFANLTAPVEFRFYAFGAPQTGGTWRIDDVSVLGTATMP